MKQSLKTGKEIYLELKNLYNELEEVGKAVDMVEEEVGGGSLPHKILKDKYNEKNREISLLERVKYTTGITESLELF